MDAVLHTTNIHSSSLALPGLLRLIRWAAWIPSGVAALPSPNRLADTLAQMQSMVSRSRAALGKSSRSTGLSSRDRPSASPERRITSITPIHRHSIPAIPRHSSTAEPAPSTAAAATCSPRPVASPHKTDSTAIAVQITDMVILSPPYLTSILVCMENNSTLVLDIFLKLLQFFLISVNFYSIFSIFSHLWLTG